MGDKPFFSVIMPIYNRANIVEQTLRKIVDQSFSNFEVIIVDDGSSDETAQTITSVKDARIKYIYQENSGPLKARARAASVAKGAWLVFCDSDDWWEKNYLEQISRSLVAGSMDCIISNYQVGGESKPRLGALEEKEKYFSSIAIENQNGAIKLSREGLFRKLLYLQPIMLSAYAINRNFYEKIGGIDTSLNVIGSEDSDITLRASALGSTAYISECLVHLGRGEDNLSSNYIRNLEGGTEILENLKKYDSILTEFKKEIDFSINRQRLEIAYQYYWIRDLEMSSSSLERVNIKASNFIRVNKLILKILYRKISKYIKFLNASR